VASPATEPIITAATTLAVMSGALLLGASLLKLGTLADYISTPILTGFKIGTALVIIASQLGKLLGIDAESQDFAKVSSALSQLGDANVATVVLSITSIGALVLLRRLSPRIPGALVVVVMGILAVSAFDLTARGVAVVPPVPSGLPKFTAPDPALLVDLLPAAVGIALMCFVESIAAARVPAPGGGPSRHRQGAAEPWAARTWPAGCSRHCQPVVACRRRRSTTPTARSHRCPAPSQPGSALL
jgi:SulP family sulfate permease